MVNLPRLDEIDMEAILARRRELYSRVSERTATRAESNEEWALLCFYDDPERCYKNHNPERGEADSFGTYCSDFFSRYLKSKEVRPTP